MSEALDDIVAQAQADAAAAAEAAANAALERSQRQPLPAIEADDLRRGTTPQRQSPDLEKRQQSMEFKAKCDTDSGGSGSGGAGGETIEVVVVDNGEFKTGNFYIDGALTLVE